MYPTTKKIQFCHSVPGYKPRVCPRNTWLTGFNPLVMAFRRGADRTLQLPFDTFSIGGWIKSSNLKGQVHGSEHAH